MHLRVGKSLIRAMIKFLRKMVATILVGTQFIDKLIKGMFCSERKIVRFNPALRQFIEYWKRKSASQKNNKKT